MAGSDKELSVTPHKGELMPIGTTGTLIKVDFLPTKYGKVHRGKLVIQVTNEKIFSRHNKSLIV